MNYKNVASRYDSDTRLQRTKLFKNYLQFHTFSKLNSTEGGEKHNIFRIFLKFNMTLQMREGGDDRSRSNYDIEVGPARFQLQYMDYYLLREERNDPDPRVEHFIPDTWQVLRQIHLYIELLEVTLFHLKIVIIILLVKSSVSLSLTKTADYFVSVLFVLRALQRRA